MKQYRSRWELNYIYTVQYIYCLFSAASAKEEEEEEFPPLNERIGRKKSKEQEKEVLIPAPPLRSRTKTSALIDVRRFS